MNDIIRNAQGGGKSDGGKLKWTLLPWCALSEIVEVLMFGANKYGPSNWQLVEPERYKEALTRHWVAYLEGEKSDPDTGKSHLAHIGCNVLFLLWMELKGKIND